MKTGAVKMNVVSKRLTAIAIIAWSGCALAQTYTATELTGLGGPNGALALNGAGQVAGSVDTGNSLGSRIYAAVWNGTTPTILSGISGSTSSQADAINSAGQIAGYSLPPGADFVDAVVWTSVGAAPTILTSGLGGDSYAIGINATRQVAGYSSTVGNTSTNAVVWNGTTPTILTGFGGSSSASGINNAGQVVGYANTVGNASTNAVVWNGTTPTILNGLGGTVSSARRINDAGQVVGFSYTTENAIGEAVVWNGTTPTILNGLGGTDNIANDINNAGQEVGVSYTTGNAIFDAVVWNGVAVTDLNSVLTNVLPSEVRLIYAEAINDNGWIVAEGSDASQYLLKPNASPVPLPATVWLLLSGLGGVGFLGRQKRTVRSSRT